MAAIVGGNVPQAEIIDLAQGQAKPFYEVLDTNIVGENDERVCNVCFESLKDLKGKVVVAHQGGESHPICLDDAREWVVNKGNHNCPTCRKTIDVYKGVFRKEAMMREVRQIGKDFLKGSLYFAPLSLSHYAFISVWLEKNFNIEATLIGVGTGVLFATDLKDLSGIVVSAFSYCAVGYGLLSIASGVYTGSILATMTVSAGVGNALYGIFKRNVL